MNTMIKTFEQFNTNQELNEGEIGMYMPNNTFISPDSSYWQKAINFFKAETGKDLTSFKWVFQDSNVDSSIIPQNFIVALLGSSPVTSKYKGMIDYLKDFLSQGNMKYEVGNGPDYVTVGANSLQNSGAIYKIWIDHFYLPIKKAVQTKNFDSITPTGMESFEERMHIFNMDFDSDWAQFFSTIKIGLQPVEVQVSAQPASQTMPQQQTQAKVAQPKSSGGKKSSGSYSLPTSFK
jgi:hypothetical protein